MATIVPVPALVPSGDLINQRSIELGALLVAIVKLSNIPDERDGLTPASVAALNQLAVRLHGELDRMLANAYRAGALDGTARTRR